MFCMRCACAEVTPLSPRCHFTADSDTNNDCIKVVPLVDLLTWCGGFKHGMLVNSSSLSLRQATWNVTRSSVRLWRVKTRHLSLSSVVRSAQVRCFFSQHLVSSWDKLLWWALCGVLCADEPRIPAGLRASVKSCRYNGSIYQPGETFTKHDLFPSKQSNQCVMCTCSVSCIYISPRKRITNAWNM